MSMPSSPNPADMYENYFVPAMFRPWATVLLSLATPKPGERVLDVACGTGVVARAAAPMVGAKGQVVGLDLNPAMLALARSLPAPPGAQIQWMAGNAVQLPFEDASFDAVLCQHGLPFFPDRTAAVCEMRRVLAPGGRALAVVLQSIAQHPVFETLMGSIARHLSLPITSVATPFAMSDAEQLRALFIAAGFKTTDIVAKSIVARFAQADRFVPLAVMSSAAAIPAFFGLLAPERAALIQAVAADIGPTVQQYRQGDTIEFGMFAHIAQGAM